MPRVFAAIDIGASGGRVMAGIVSSIGIELQPIHRFPNSATARDGHLRWDIERLFDEVLIGLERLASEHPDVESIGVDTWAVDYALLDDEQQLIAQPIAYRDDRTTTVIDEVHRRISPDELYRINGLQFLPFNTMYQLAADQRGELWDRAAHIVLLPDLIAFWLTGALGAEYTNASTTGLVDARTRDWSLDLLERLGIAPSLLSPVQQPGTARGVLHNTMCRRLGMRADVEVITVGSHDTASAVAGLPSRSDRFAYVSSGTWSLVGLELAVPILTADARAANFTNEGGVDDRVRFLRNVGGLWLLQESVRTWAEKGNALDLGDLLAAAASLPDGGPTFDVDEAAFIPPGDMPSRINDVMRARGKRPPATPIETTRCIIDSLAAGYASTLRRASQLAQKDIDTLHIVGGGSQNELLCQQTANRTGLPVVAGPVEATAIGNIAVQARTKGALPASCDDVRRLIATDPTLREYQPVP